MGFPCQTFIILCLRAFTAVIATFREEMKLSAPPFSWSFKFSLALKLVSCNYFHKSNHAMGDMAIDNLFVLLISVFIQANFYEIKSIILLSSIFAEF